jgi:hypothetical protein
MKTIFPLILVILLFSCKKSDTLTPKSTLTELAYPTSSGNSGDTLTGVLGYGYDATGICDTLSIRAKILNLNQTGDLVTGKYLSGSSELLSGYSFDDFLNNLYKYPNKISDSKTAILSHIRSLLKLAYKSDSIDINYAYAYYSKKYFYSGSCYYINYLKLDSEITSNFKSDIKILSPEKIVQKYGTHVLTDVVIGTKLEVLYRCDLNSVDAEGVEQGLYKRMKQYFGATLGTIKSENYTLKNEQLIYNTIGSKTKLFGIINATDYNPDNIHFNIDSIFGNNMEFQFISIKPDGLVPIYDLINDSVKKQELKNYINLYISE